MRQEYERGYSKTNLGAMIMQSFYIAEDEAYGIRESEGIFPDSDASMETFYDEIADYYDENLDMELVF